MLEVEESQEQSGDEPDSSLDESFQDAQEPTPEGNEGDTAEISDPNFDETGPTSFSGFEDSGGEADDALRFDYSHYESEDENMESTPAPVRRSGRNRVGKKTFTYDQDGNPKWLGN